MMICHTSDRIILQTDEGNVRYIPPFYSLHGNLCSPLLLLSCRTYPTIQLTHFFQTQLSLVLPNDGNEDHLMQV